MDAARRALGALAGLPAWLIWRYESNGEKKPRKMPYYSSGRRRAGAQGGDEDRSQLVTLDVALKSRAPHTGVGLALLPGNNVVAIDFDNCVTDGVVHPEVRELVCTTYAELSPSGKGVRALFRGEAGNRKDPHSEPFGIEVFSTKGFVTITGQVLGDTELFDIEVVDLTPEMQAYIDSRFGQSRESEGISRESGEQVGEPLGLTEDDIERALNALDPDCDHDTWLQIGMALHHETRGEGFDWWDTWSQYGAKYPSRELLQHRWDSFGKGGHRPVTARTLVKLAGECGVSIGPNAMASMEEFENLALAGQPGTLSPDVLDVPRESQGSPEGIAGEFDIVDAPRESEGVAGEKKGKFPRPTSGLREMTAQPRPVWMIQNLIPRAELVVMFGPSGSGKSFLALDMAAAVARGVDWRGHKVRKGRVVYICAEGAGGFRNRAEAYLLHNGLQDVPIGVMAAQPNLLQKDDALEVARLIGKADLIIIDTWAQTTAGGDENSAEDMGKALAHCKGIHRATGATVMLIHHAGKDLAKGARGWSGLRAAADAELEVMRTGTARYVRVSKQKDGEDNGVIGFGLESVAIGMDEWDEVITSCVVIDVDAREIKPARKLKAVEQVVYDAFMELRGEGGEPVTREALLALAVENMPKPEDGQRDRSRFKVERALAGLVEGDEPVLLADGDGLVLP